MATISAPATLLASALLLTSQLLTTQAAFASGSDELWEVTAKMAMAGMPMALPAHTMQVCKPAGAMHKNPVPDTSHGNCHMTDLQRDGNTTRFKMACTGANAMQGEGEVIYDGSSKYSGKMHFTGSPGGHAVDMTETFSGHKIGTCTYRAPGS